MQKQGEVVRWNAERAFGFIRSADTDADVFFHVRDFQGGGAPREGQAVVYEEIHVGGKGPRAMAVQPAGAQAAARASARSAPGPSASKPRQARPSRTDQPRGTPAFQGLAFLLMGAWAGLLAFGAWNGRLPIWLLGGAVALNLLTFAVYFIDKQAAKSDQWRTSENTLHGLALAGGWPGAWFAQQMLRHKSSKAAFRAVYWATVIANCAGLAVWVIGWVR
jgi:uncharacterized membrane protein YsdA (DUF1294 family)/cold shock CspA family protein